MATPQHLDHAGEGSGLLEPEFRFPPLPRTVAEVSTLLAERSEIPDTPRLVEITHHDPIVGARVLRKINSAYYGMARQISKVRQAIFLLGFEEVCNIVLTAGMLQLKEVLQTRAQRDLFEAIMKESLGAAYYTRMLALHGNLEEKDTAFTVGLMQGIGRLVMLYNAPEACEELWREGGADPERERGHFGFDHAVMAAHACRHWGLPDLVGDVLGAVEDPYRLGDRDTRLLALTLRVALDTVRVLDREEPPEGPALAALAGALEMEPAVMADLLASHRKRALRYIEVMHG